MAHINETQGDLMQPFLDKFLQFLLCNLRYISLYFTGASAPSMKEAYENFNLGNSYKLGYYYPLPTSSLWCT